MSASPPLNSDPGSTLRDAADKVRRRRAELAQGVDTGRLAAARAGTSRRRHADDGGLRSLNRNVGWILALIVVVAPLPVGSNRAVVWMLWSTLVLATAAVYFWRLAILRRGLQQHGRFYPWLIGPPLLLLAYGAVQILPLGASLGLASALPGIDSPAPKTLSIAPDASRLALLRMTGSVMFFILMLEVAVRTSRARQMAWVLFASVTLYAVWGMVALKVLGDTHFWGPKTSYIGAATGPFINRNAFATFLGMGAVLGLALLFDKLGTPQGRKARGSALTSPESIGAALIWVALGLILVCLVMTQSRMGLLSAILGLGVVLIGAPRRTSDSRGRGYLVTVLSLAALGALAWVAAGGVMDRTVYIAAAADERIEIYRQTLRMIAARPLTGYGADSFALGFEMFHRPTLSSAVTYEFPHSSYLTLWVDFGLIFGSLLVVAGGAAVLRLVHLVRHRTSDPWLPLAALAATVAFSTHALVDFGAEMQANLFLFLAILALGLARRGDPVPSGPVWTRRREAGTRGDAP